jgi:hypothetical protein
LVAQHIDGRLGFDRVEKGDARIRWLGAQGLGSPCADQFNGRDIVGR